MRHDVVCDVLQGEYEDSLLVSLYQSPVIARTYTPYKIIYQSRVFEPAELLDMDVIALINDVFCACGR